MSTRLRFGCQLSELLEDPRFPVLREQYEAECRRVRGSHGGWRREFYEAAEQSGMGECITAYWDDELVGFAFVLYATPGHYSSMMAVVESLFTEETVRQFGVGNELRSEVRFAVRARRYSEILWTAPEGSAFEKVLRADRRCELAHLVFSEVLK